MTDTNQNEITETVAKGYQNFADSESADEAIIEAANNLDFADYEKASVAAEKAREERRESNELFIKPDEALTNDTIPAITNNGEEPRQAQDRKYDKFTPEQQRRFAKVLKQQTSKLARQRNQAREQAVAYRSALEKAGLLDANDPLGQEWWVKKGTFERQGRSPGELAGLEAASKAIEDAELEGDLNHDWERTTQTREERDAAKEQHLKYLTEGLKLEPEAAEARVAAAEKVQSDFPEHIERLQEISEYVPDFEELRQVAMNIPITPGLGSSIAQLPNSADVVVQLAMNPAWAEQLNYLPRGLQQRALRELSAEISALNGDSEGPDQAVKDAYNQHAEEARAKHGDFDQALNQEWDASPEQQKTYAHVEQACLEMEDGPEVAYYLAKNPEERDELLSMSPNRAVAQLGRISAALAESDESEDKRSALPAPLRPVRRSGKVSAAFNPLDPSTWNGFSDYEKKKAKWDTDHARAY